MEKLHALHAEKKYKKRKWVAPYYYDYPDGEDLLGKLSYTVKLALTGSAIAGLLYANSTPQTDTAGKIRRLGKYVIPGVGMAVAFTCVTYYATKLRGKDDQWNYVLGGLAAGSILGPATGYMRFSVFGMLGCAITGGFKKNLEMKGEKFVSKDVVQSGFSTFYRRKFDTTLAPELPGNWTRDPPKN